MTRDSTPRRKPWNKWAIIGAAAGAIAIIGGTLGVINLLTEPAPTPTPSVTSPSASVSP